MNLSSIKANEVVDTVLEATIVGSFTKLGYGARERVFDWDQKPADMTGKSVVITGGTSGIGRATAEGLIELGAVVHLTSRDLERAMNVAGELNRSGRSGSAVGRSLDTGDFDSISEFVDGLRADGVRIDVLINNAGALTDEYRTDDRGTELTLSTHLIGPYLLTKQMRPLLVKGAMVLFMSSGGMYTQGLDVDRIEMRESSYKGAVAYARAKRGQVELVEHLGPLWAPDVILHAVHPGWVDTDGVAQGLPGFGKIMGPLLRSPEQGADTMVWLASTGADGAEPGQFWHDRKPRRTVYVPGTGTTPAERARLVEWLDRETQV